MASFQIRIVGMVQGIGFRPFIERLAKQLSICGEVKNNGGAVDIIAVTSDDILKKFVASIKVQAPLGASIVDIKIKTISQKDFSKFSIARSDFENFENRYISVDLPLCDDCERELYDEHDSRFLYPFISCTACGPRYSIIEEIPYDRPLTTMKDFALCSHCAGEYVGDDRRKHAQTISCHDCGPQLIFHSSFEDFEKQAALDCAVRLLNNGGVIAVKGIGGYHLVCSPFDETAVEKLRAYKNRDKKPFAVMFRNTDEIKKYCDVSPKEVSLLQSVARPIVLAKRKPSSICDNVYAQSRFLGVFLPYTPLQCLLIDHCGALIFTSANLTDEPIIVDDSEMLASSVGLDGVLYNTRRIVAPLDDSVAQIVCGKERMLRRSRGFVPQVIATSFSSLPQIFAAGGDLKAAFAYYKNGNVYFSQHFGDLQNHAVFGAFERADSHMQSLFNLQPQLAVCDLNSSYFSNRYAQKKGLDVQFIQHHHAHVACVMAEHNIDDCIGIAFDGTGLGDDGAVWGSEFMLCKGEKMQRVAHLEYVEVCGYDNAAKNAAVMASCALYAATGKMRTDDAQFSLLKTALDSHFNTCKCGSVGRLFDAVASILGVCQFNSFEGECAILLENAAYKAQSDAIKPTNLCFKTFDDCGIIKIDQSAMICDIVDAFQQNEDVNAISLGFHLALSNLILSICKTLRCKHDKNKVALSGGVFLNQILLETTHSLLEQDGFEVYINQKVPSNDGGIALGQLYIALKSLEKEGN